MVAKNKVYRKIFKRCCTKVCINMKKVIILNFIVVLIFFTVYACGKKEADTEKDKTAVSVIEKKAEVQSSTESIPAEIGESYKGVVVISEIEGINWQKGLITAVGKGLPPKHITNQAQAEILAIRAAKMEAYKNLLETVMKIKTPPDKDMKEYLVDKNIESSHIEGFVKGARVVKEEYLDDGSAKVVLELSLTGNDGLVAVLK